MDEQKIKFAYDRFLTVPLRCGSVVASSIKTLDENCSEILHSHLEYEIYYCIDGELKLRVEGETHLMRPGDYFILRPNVVHGAVDEPDIKREYLVFIFQLVKGQQADMPKSEKQFFRFFEELFAETGAVRAYDGGECMPLLREIQELVLSQSFGRELELRGQVIRLLLQFMRKFSVPCENDGDESPDTENVAVTIDQFIHMNFCRDISIQDAADFVHMSPRNVNRVLQKYYGRSFQKLLEASRLGSAKKYLIETNSSIEKISELVGFSSSKPLFRLFQENEGMSPNEYRRKRKNIKGD